ncbi:MAG: heme ABC exporter ATP-binding protein CcmA [Actinobacteria bacterium]|nr:heme ABC exporter ATP-binding protein CcmA [Actinomycetota bacterium]
MESLDVNALTVHLGERKVLDQLSLQINAGTFTAILGPSGCGKTTLLRAIAGLVRPSSGAIRFGKQLVSISSLVLPPHKRKIGYLPQEAALFPHLTVFENIAYALEREKFTKDQKRKIVHEMLELIGLVGYGDRMPSELSGGQQTRVALARALALEPKVVLLDEPFSALDATLRSELREEVTSLLKKRGATTLMVTHDREEALVTADMIALMRDGKIVQHGAPDEVYSTPTTPYAALSTGDALVLPARRDGENFFHPLSASLSPEGSESGILVIRPEEITLSKSSAAGQRAIVTKVEYYGHDAVVEFGLIESAYLGTLKARVAGKVHFTPGESVFVSHDGPVRWFST